VDDGQRSGNDDEEAGAGGALLEDDLAAFNLAPVTDLREPGHLSRREAWEHLVPASAVYVCHEKFLSRIKDLWDAFSHMASKHASA